MFVRVKSTPNSPRKSIQIVESYRKGDKVSQKIVRYVGIAMDDNELEQLKLLAESIKIKLEADNQELLFSPEELAQKDKKAKDKKAQQSEEDYKVNLKDLVEEQRVVSGIHDVYGKLFDDMQCASVIANPARNRSAAAIFRDIVLSRIANPKSKRATVDLLEENFGVSLNLDKVYRMMDKLDDRAIEKLNKLMYEHTKKLYGGKIDVIFFDCTTLYFESFEEDEFRRNGYSKDLKFNQPQVLLALMVTKEGLPIGYKAFSGDTYEGHTLIPALRELKEKYKLDKVVYVADAGMFNKDNLAELEILQEQGFQYIVGARLKNMPKKLKEEILNQDNYKEISSGHRIARFNYNGRELIVSHSAERASKDMHDRKKAIEKLKKKLARNKSPKEYLSNYGYKKYLKVQGESSISLNEEKIQAESRWDGLHGVVTNSKNLSNQEIMNQYNSLWQVEEAFRVTKHDLKVRPIYHFKPQRVKAHLSISFTAYALVKHLQYRVKLQYKKLSPEKIRQHLISVQTSILLDTKKRIRYGLPSRMSQQARKIYQVQAIERKITPYIINKL
ncbi:MAG: IS1634 family transposase [Candidatus Brocadiales bacterium]|nr:IS1634 family transposase [Candidatus Brocadiales bacterium]